MNELSSLNTAVLFTNWTNEDFVGMWGGQKFLFKARSSESIGVGDLPHNEGLARHFAKHLTDRELNKRGVPTDHHTRQEFERNCFISTADTQPIPTLDVEIHPDTGLVKAVTRTGSEDPKTGKKTKTKPVVEEVMEEEEEEEEEEEVEEVDEEDDIPLHEEDEEEEIKDTPVKKGKGRSKSKKNDEFEE